MLKDTIYEELIKLNSSRYEFDRNTFTFKCLISNSSYIVELIRITKYLEDVSIDYEVLANNDIQLIL